MSSRSNVDATVEEEGRPNYSGAIYGSMLAASVVVGAGAGGGPLTDAARISLLVATGLVFWIAHAYARLVGDRIHHAELNWRGDSASCRGTSGRCFQAALLAGRSGSPRRPAGWGQTPRPPGRHWP